MDPFDFTRALTEFWTVQGKALAAAQEQAGRVMAEGMQAMASNVLASDLSGGTAELARASDAMAELWKAAMAMSEGLAKAPAPGGDATVEAVFARISDPRQWMSGTGEMDDVLGRMAEGPRFADLWEIERRYAKVMQAWITVRRRGLEHNAVVLEGWLHASKQFTEELAGRTGADGVAPDHKAALALWTETANRQLLETQRSDAFLQTQREMIRSSTELRMAQQELVEHVGKQYGFPTRTELDDVHRTVTELRREQRTLRREVRAALARQQPPAPPMPAPPPPAQAPRRAARKGGTR